MGVGLQRAAMICTREAAQMPGSTRKREGGGVGGGGI